jgi:hypothetical protein
MLKAHGDDYMLYMERTGMFMPKAVEQFILPKSKRGKLAVFFVLTALITGAAFFLRSYTISHLPTWSNNNVVAMSILDDDKFKMEHRMPDIIQIDEIRKRLNDQDKYLVYFLPPHYIMQGLIADTGIDWKLYKQHHAISMIMDWIFHPFSHLSEAHYGILGGMQHDVHSANIEVAKKLIFIKIENARSSSVSDMFSINARRIPQFIVDIDVHNLQISNLRDRPSDTGWGTVPTPVF